MEPYMMAYVWIALAIVMVLVEITTVQLVSVWFMVGALCAALTTLFTDSIVIQLAVFVGVSLLALLVTRPLVRRLKENRVQLRTNIDRLPGEKGVMLKPVENTESVGQAKVLGKVWSVKTDNPPLKEGDTVRVIAVDGVKLIVEKVF
ncbi:MAG: NfeD family protein [Ruminococcus sp.]|jgi:membrane protein implicated in regulation of membrane protease activity|nr:NfeD family protein [Ruminococcus sp.]MBQ1308191.1 NfeD family protein [Ruminococcus sp.]MBQ1381243.1 NfeD family protein [Ruminococcus sp.]MBQ1638549.1 NfeD family protein [Ruminococcus sp.]MBQ1685996.1 NfeD family protein [Ruminococcus sp.]